MAMASGEASQETHTLVSGVILKLKDSVYTLGKMAIVMRASGLTIKWKEKENIIMQMGANTRVIL